MKIISIGRFVQNFYFKTNIQNFKTWSAMSIYFEEIYLIVESTDQSSHYEDLGKLKVYWLPRHSNCIIGRIQFMLQAYMLSRKLLPLHGIDVINVGEPVVAGLVGVLLKRIFKKPLICQIQGQLLDLPKGTFSWLKTRYIVSSTKYVCKHSDRIRVVSNEIREKIIKIGVPDEIVFMIPSRCDVEIFNPKRYVSERRLNRIELGYSDDDIVIEFTGRIVEYRDIESNLEALKILIYDSNRFKFLIVGDGPDVKRLKSICEDLDIIENVRFFGKVPFSDVPKILSIADIFISTPTNEGIARSVLEAMAMELPVIATRVGGTPEAIEDGESGILVGVKSPMEIVAAVRTITSSGETCRNMGVAARKVIVNKYEFHKCIKQFADVHFGLS